MKLTLLIQLLKLTGKFKYREGARGTFGTGPLQLTIFKAN